MIDCCNGCVPPKRNAWCHSYCPEYAKQKEKHDRQKAIHDQQRSIDIGIVQQRGDRVYKALKCRRNKKI